MIAYFNRRAFISFLKTIYDKSSYEYFDMTMDKDNGRIIVHQLEKEDGYPIPIGIFILNPVFIRCTFNSSSYHFFSVPIKKEEVNEIRSLFDNCENCFLETSKVIYEDSRIELWLQLIAEEELLFVEAAYNFLDEKKGEQK